MTKHGQVHLEDLPASVQEHIRATVTKKHRTSQAVSPEKKVAAAAGVLTALSAFSIPQQRTILKFALDVLAGGQRRWATRTKEANP